MSSFTAYADGMAVELFDHVEMHLPEGTFEGQVTAVYPLRGELRLRYADHRNPRRDGETKTRSTVALVQQVELIRRDG